MNENENKNENGYYYSSNDLFDLSEYNFENRDGTIFIGIANPHCFHAIPLDISIDRIVLTDVNQKQVDHLNFMIDCIKQSEKRMDFVGKFMKINFKDGFDPSKENIWKNSKWISEPIGEMTEKGIMYDAKDNFGGISKHRLTIFEDDTDPSCFYLGYGKGWLKSEESFSKVKEMCEKIEIYCCDIADFYNENWDEIRYRQVILWISNLLSPWFVFSCKKVSSLWDRLCLSLDSKLPKEEIDVKVIFDRRSHIPVDKRFVKGGDKSSHFKAFREVVLEISRESNLEVPGVEKWISEDEGKSKLPFTKYTSLRNFYSKKRAKCVFLHGLMSHEKDIETAKRNLLKAFSHAKKISSKVIVLEFNKDTQDNTDGLGVAFDELSNLLGQPSRFKGCEGECGDVRNWLFVYE